MGSKKASRRQRQTVVEFSELESRVLFAAVFPTPQEQYILQLINRARANPTAEVQRTAASNVWPNGVTPDLNEGIPAGTIPATPKQPLAMNPFILDAARKHTQYLFANPNAPGSAHNEVINGLTVGPTERVVAAGYNFPGVSAGENIWTSFGTPGGGGDLLQPLLALEQQPFVDWVNGGTPGRGHRTALMNDNRKEVGLGLGTVQVPIGSTTVTKYVVTQDFSNPPTGSFLCGVTYQDLNANQFYEPGEEATGVTITATRTSDNKVFSTTTWGSGGYSLAVEPGNYNVTATGGILGPTAPQNITIGALNVAADFFAAPTNPALILTAPVITTQPVSIQLAVDPTRKSFTVAASGNPTPTIQWQTAAAGSDTFNNVVGETKSTFVPYIDAGRRFRAVLTNSQGTAISDAVTVTPAPPTPPNTAPIVITTPLKDQTVNAGDKVTLAAAATGYTQVTWALTNPATGGVSGIDGATSPTYTFTADASMNGKTFTAIFFNGTNSDRTAAVLTVNAANTTPTVTVQPQPQTVPNGGDATLTTDVTGFPNPTVDWQVQGDPANPVPAAAGVKRPSSASVWHDVPGGTGLTLTVSAAGGTQRYRAVISNGEGSVTTTTATVTANKRSAVSNVLTSLRTAAKAAIAAIEACRKATESVTSKLKADLRRLKASRSATALVNTLSTNERNARAVFTANEKKVLSALEKAAGRAADDSYWLKRHPGDAKLTARLQADLAALQAAADSSTAPADATACKLATTEQLAPLSAVAPTDLRLQSDLTAAQTNAFNIGQALQAPMTVAISVAAQLKAAAT